jgi:hypothetical protein
MEKITVFHVIKPAVYAFFPASAINLHSIEMNVSKILLLTYNGEVDFKILRRGVVKVNSASIFTAVALLNLLDD